MALSIEDLEQLKVLERRIEELTAQKEVMERTLPLYQELEVAVRNADPTSQNMERATQLMSTLGIEGTVKDVVFPSVLIQAERKIKDLEQEILTSKLQVVNVKDYNLGQAYTVFGNDLYGPAHVQNMFGVEVPKQNVPQLPSKEVMATAKSLGDVLALRVYGAMKKYLIGKYGETLYDDTTDKNPDGKCEWVMFRKEFLPETVYKTYLEQTRAIRNYLKAQGFLRADEEAECTDQRLQQIWEQGQSQPEQAASLLARLKINQRHRHSPEDIMYFNKLIGFTDWDFEATNADPSAYQRIKYLPRFFVLVGKFGDSRVGIGHINGMEFHKNLEAEWVGRYRQGVRVVF